ncbi:MAG: 6-carboxytetrahydropterin synthase [Planctomycetes bacterium]|nr:6-carboxytetrahydropterin synthase [Planctomycetota bacterium]
MSRPTVEITHREEFSSAHRLHDPALSDEENRRLYGICHRDHGHNYALEVTVVGPIPTSGMVMDLKSLGSIIQERIVAVVDHRHLNHDVPFLAGTIPTAENLAVAFWHQIEPDLKGYAGCRLHRIRVYESRNNFVDFLGASPAR